MAAEKQGTEGQGKWMYPKLYFIGDSNTQQGYSCGGFLGMLANEYIRICDVVARGFSGYTSDHLNLMIPELLQNDNQPKGTIETAVILLGSNDSVDEKLDNRHVPIKKFKQNIQNIVKALKENNVKNIVLMSPPPVDDVAWGKWLWNKKNKSCANFNSNLPKYVDVCKRVADMHNLTYVDLFNDMLTNQEWRSFFVDGLHFSQKGHSYVFYKLKEVLDSIYANREFIYPDFSLIDHQQPEKDLL